MHKNAANIKLGCIWNSFAATRTNALQRGEKILARPPAAVKTPTTVPYMYTPHWVYGTHRYHRDMCMHACNRASTYMHAHIYKQKNMQKIQDGEVHREKKCIYVLSRVTNHT